MMRYLLRYCGSVLLLNFIAAYSVCSSQEPTTESKPSAPSEKKVREHDEVLKFVKIPDSALPKNVRLVEHPPTAPILPITRNPDVLVDPKKMMLLGLSFGVQTRSDWEQVRFGVAAIYQEDKRANEIGVFGLRFVDEGAAKARFEKLAKDKEDSSFILKGKLLLYVWKDPGASDTAFEAVRDYLKSAEFKPAQRP